MAGHSKWANIKHTKGKEDAKRGKLYTKLGKEITVAARIGGGDATANPRLRRAIQSARSGSMPNENIERAIKRGTGELEGLTYEEVTFEGYGAGGVAVLVDCVTDNRVRTVAEIRFIFSKCSGNMGEQGCVSWIFENKGLIIVPAPADQKESLEEVAIESGADDILFEDESCLIYTSVDDFDGVRDAIEKAKLNITKAEITKIPSNSVQVTGTEAQQTLKLLSMLEDNDDVQNVSANFEMDDSELQSLSQSVS